jgi:hypothetical protein
MQQWQQLQTQTSKTYMMRHGKCRQMIIYCIWKSNIACSALLLVSHLEESLCRDYQTSVQGQRDSPMAAKTQIQKIKDRIKGTVVGLLASFYEKYYKQWEKNLPSDDL